MQTFCWAISDGRAGNEKQVLALAHALGHTPRLVRIALRAPWRWLAPTGPPDPRKALPVFLRDQLAPPWPALAIGCGRAAALVTLGLKRMSGGTTQAVQILDPRRHRTRFDALIVPEHDGLSGGNVLSTIGALNRIDEAWLADGREAFAQFADLPSPRTAVLVGGSTRAVSIDGHFVDAVLSILDHWQQRDGGSFLVTCSRRTPAALVRRLRQRFERGPGVFWANDDDGPNPYPGLLAWAERIVVTPDSANLLSEACATGTPVLVHTGKPVRGRLGLLLGELIASGRVRPLKLNYQPWTYSPLRELSRVAVALQELLRNDLHQSN